MNDIAVFIQHVSANVNLYHLLIRANAWPFCGNGIDTALGNDLLLAMPSGTVGYVCGAVILWVNDIPIRLPNGFSHIGGQVNGRSENHLFSLRFTDCHIWPKRATPG